MTTKELIQAEIGPLDENDLNEIYSMIRRFIESKRHASHPSLMAKLKQIGRAHV